MLELNKSERSKVELSKTLSRLIKRKKNLSYALGRFRLVRRLYSTYRAVTENSGDRTFAAPTKESVSQSIFRPVFQAATLSQIDRKLRQDAVFLGFNLPAATIDAIKTFAGTAPLTREDDSPPFYYSDVKDGTLADGRAVPQAIAIDPWDCDALKQIAYDPLLLEVITKYLGYRPQQIQPILKWSFVTCLSDEERIRLHQTVKYHYDVHGFNFFYANFYITDTDRDSGAHVMIKRSHNHKPLWMLFNSANQPEQVLHQYYGAENELVIEGKAGLGFLQDASCYHKALKPIKQERLMLQIRCL